MMNIHASLLLQHSQGWAKDDPLVLAGDFNFYPTNTTYQLVLEGEIPENDPQRPVPSPKVKGNPSGRFRPMRSAYKEAGGEPEFTSLSWSTTTDSVNLEIMDYIFISKEWGVRQVLRGEKSADFLARGVRAIPCANEPSDHMLVSATLQLNFK
jgi:endonuclease/exonuclease/phosphatase family metal-dependent hydrolase